LTELCPQKKETEDAIEDLLTHLEEFCGLIEMIRNDSNICVEEVSKKVAKECRVMDTIYSQIDKLEQFVTIVRKTVEDMDAEMTRAEQLFADDNNNRVKKFFSSLMSSNAKQSHFKRINAKYEPKEIFRTSDYIKSCDLGLLSQTTNAQNCDHSSQTTANGSTHSAII
jgi:hypothetical protein